MVYFRIKSGAKSRLSAKLEIHLMIQNSTAWHGRREHKSYMTQSPCRVPIKFSQKVGSASDERTANTSEQTHTAEIVLTYFLAAPSFACSFPWNQPLDTRRVRSRSVITHRARGLCWGLVLILCIHSRSFVRIWQNRFGKLDCATQKKRQETQTQPNRQCP